MTVRNREWATRFDNFEACADNAPAGTYEKQKDLRRLIGGIVDALISGLPAHGLRGDNCDRARDLEIEIYRYLVESNPDEGLFYTAEGFGSAMEGPARERVISQAASNLANLRLLGVVP